MNTVELLTDQMRQLRGEAREAEREKDDALVKKILRAFMVLARQRARIFDLTNGAARDKVGTE